MKVEGKLPANKIITSLNTFLLRPSLKTFFCSTAKQSTFWADSLPFSKREQKLLWKKQQTSQHTEHIREICAVSPSEQCQETDDGRRTEHLEFNLVSVILKLHTVLREKVHHQCSKRAFIFYLKESAVLKFPTTILAYIRSS